MDSRPSEKRFALIIDADNVSSKYIKPITDELSKYGTITYKRIYGDWTSTLHAKWKDALLENSITPIQQFSYTTGKNATDSAMIIDAMDIMYTNSVEGFCIVSSDSDFTRLASRIRESGLTVIGMGEKKTPTPFRKACDIFTTLELLVGDGGKQGGRRGHRAQGGAGAGQGSGPVVEQVERAVVDIVTDNQNNGKATGLGEVGSRLLKRYPDFDVRSYGTNQLTKLLGEFSSVQVIKDGSSVMVELTEGSTGSPVEEADAVGSVLEVQAVDLQVAAQDAVQAEVAISDEPSEAAAEGVEGDPKPDGEKPKRSRRGRSRRGRSKAATLEADGRSRERQASQDDSAAAAKASEASEAESTDVQLREAEPVGDSPADAPAEPAASGEQPREASRRSSSRRRRQRSSHKDEGGARETDALAASDMPKPSSESQNPAGAQHAPEAEDGSALEKPAGKRRSPRRSKRASQPQQTPEAFIFDLVRDAGSEGVNVGELNKRVRATFKSFKVRDLGFTQMRQYVGSLPDIEVERRGRDYFAKLEE